MAATDDDGAIILARYVLDALHTEPHGIVHTMPSAFSLPFISVHVHGRTCTYMYDMYALCVRTEVKEGRDRPHKGL